MKDPKSKLFSERKLAAGFIVVDASDPSMMRPVALTGSGLFALSNKPSVFRIEMRKPRLPGRFSDRDYSYRYARKQLLKIIDRHHLRLSQMQSSALTRDWMRTKKAALLKLKIKTLKHEP